MNKVVFWSLTYKRFLASVPKKLSDVKFSESKAYAGFDRYGKQNLYMTSQFKPTYYDSRSYSNKKLVSFMGSFFGVVAYFAFFRQENDLDRIFNTPGHILSSNLERRMIRVQIEEAVASGKDTSLLEAELAYIDVKEAALKVKFEN